MLQGYNPPKKSWMEGSELYLLKQGCLPLELYIAQLEKLSLEANIDKVVKRDLFIKGLNQNLQKYLQLQQPNTYQEVVRLAHVKNSVKRESDESIMLQEVLRKLSKIETKKQNEETVSALTSYQQNNVANPVDAMMEVSRLEEEIRRLKTNRKNLNNIKIGKTMKIIEDNKEIPKAYNSIVNMDKVTQEQITGIVIKKLTSRIRLKTFLDKVRQETI